MLEGLKRWARELKLQLMTLWYCRKHPDTPWTAKALAVIVVAYAFSPIDLIPDFIPVFGYLDDLILVPLGIYLALRLMPPHVLAEARAHAMETASTEKPGGYWAAAGVIAIWLVVACLAWRMLI